MLYPTLLTNQTHHTDQNKPNRPPQNTPKKLAEQNQNLIVPFLLWVTKDIKKENIGLLHIT
jgi:hypothetical protein